MKKPVKNIVFDLGGVLLDLDLQACIDALSAIGFPHPERMLNPYKQHGIFLALDEGRIPDSEFYDYIRRESGRDTPDSEIRAAYCRFLVGIPLYKLEMLRTLRERFRVYLLSNTNHVMMPYIEETFFTREGRRVDDYFDRLFLSYEMKRSKPDPEIYRMMLREGGFEAEETLFLDDSAANVETAGALGFRTRLVKPREDYRDLFDTL